jgi:hypothetical protein
MHQSEFGQHAGTENIRASIEEALERAKAPYQQMEQQSLHLVGGSTSSSGGNH